MSKESLLKGLYVITDNTLTPNNSIEQKVTLALECGANIIQLRDKENNKETVRQTAKKLQKLCIQYNALFVLNDDIDLAIELQCDGLHIGKSDYHRFEQIRKEFNGIIGVSCYGDIQIAKEFEQKGANYVAFGSFYSSPTKPNSEIVPLETITNAKKILQIPVCVIGGINIDNLQEITDYKPDMLSVISDIWKSDDITQKVKSYKKILNLKI